MLVPLTLLSLSLLWILIVSIIARTLFPNRFRNRPRLGLTVWFASLSSSIIAGALGLFGLGAAYFYSTESVSRLTIGEPDWFIAFAWSFVPWVFLATFGVLLALVNVRIEMPVLKTKQIQQDIRLARSELPNFQGVRVFSIRLPIHFAFATKDEIVVSEHSVKNLTKTELEAVLWHELGHIKGKHHLLKSVSELVALLTRPMSISRVYRAEVESLCEEAADNFAKRHVGAQLVEKVRSVMREA